MGYEMKCRFACAWVLLFLLCFVMGKGFSWTARATLAYAEADADQSSDFSMEVISVASRSNKQKRVYLYHTHTYEAYEMDGENRYTPTETWRTADPNYNIVRVGAELTARLREAGIFVTHDATAYEPPRLSTAYSRSLEGLKQAAAEGYDLYIDLHRDSYSKGNGPNVIEVEGQPAARLLILIGQGTGSALDEKPDCETNEKAAQAISSFLNARASDLCRGVSLKSGRYNQQAASPSMLIEVGNNKNTLPEALNAIEPLARAICQYFDALE